MAISRQEQYERFPQYEVFDTFVDPVRDQLAVEPPTEESLQLAGEIGAEVAYNIFDHTLHGQYAVKNVAFLLSSRSVEEVEPPRAPLPRDICAKMIEGAAEGQIASQFKFVKTNLTREGVVA